MLMMSSYFKWCCIFLVSGFLVITSYVFRFLPVHSVWFDGVDTGASYTLQSVGQWADVIGSWDWVEASRLSWSYPGHLRVALSTKTPVVRLPSGQYLNKAGEVFHLKHKAMSLPIIYTDSSRYHEVLSLLQTLQQNLGGVVS